MSIEFAFKKIDGMDLPYHFTPTDAVWKACSYNRGKIDEMVEEVRAWCEEEFGPQDDQHPDARWMCPSDCFYFRDEKDAAKFKLFCG